MNLDGASDFVRDLVERSLCHPLPPVLDAAWRPIATPALSPALAFYCGTLGFRLASHVPHTFATLERAGLRLALAVQAPHQALTYRFAVPHTHRLHRELKPGLVRSGQAGACPQWQPWRAWELAFQDGDGNTIVLTQPAAEGAGDHAGHGR